MRRSDRPQVRNARPAWSGAPPELFDDPDLYDGMALRRAFAYLVDLVVLAVLGFVVWIALWFIAVLTFGLLAWLPFVALPVIPVAYHTLFLGSAGATPGMRYFDVEIRSWSGARPDYFQAFLQTVLFYTTIGLTTPLILLVALFNDRRRTLHDILAGTVAIRRGSAADPAA